MPSYRLIAVVVAVLLSSCAWLLPAASPSSSSEATAAAAAACTLELTERRRALSTSVAGAGAAQPLIISLTDVQRDDRTIRDGSNVTLRRAAGGGATAARETKSVPARVELVAPRSEQPAAIEDRAIVRLRSPGGDPATQGSAAATRQSAASVVDGEVAVFKADAPNANRPSTCDATLRDGDFVYLKSLEQNAWIGLADERLAGQVARRPIESPCREPKEQCYTDRSGNLLCVNYFACEAESPP